MRNFDDIRREPGLKKYSDSPLGTMYMVLDSRGVARLIIRHFDRDLSPDLAKSFVDLLHAAQEWIARHPSVATSVIVVQPAEVGSDFVARPFHIYSSTKAYVDWDDPPEVPPELEQVRQALRREMGTSTDSRDTIVETVLARSLLEPASGTYFNEDDGQFIVVELALTPDDVKLWHAVTSE